MPEKIELPGGVIVEVPEGMNSTQRNQWYNSVFKQAAAEVEPPANIPVPRVGTRIGMGPGVPESVQVKPQTARGAIDLATEYGGGTLGALTGGLAGPEGAILGAGGGAYLGKKYVGKPIQEALGLNPEPYGLLEGGAGDILANSLGEGVGRELLATPRRLKSLYRAGADAPKAATARELFFDVGIKDPPLHAILKNADPKYQVQGIYDWAAQHPASMTIIRKSNDEVVGQFQNAYYKTVDMISGIESQAARRSGLLDIEDLGEAFRTGMKKWNADWRSKGDILYAAVFDKMPREMPVTWSNTKAALEGRAALDPVGGSLSSDALKNTHRALREKYIREVPDLMRQGGMQEQALDMPFAELQNLRTQVGRRVSSWTPGSDIPQEDLVDVYKAITKDMEAAAKAAGVEEEFKAANKFWNENMELQEQVFDRINRKIKADDEIGEAVERLTKTGGGQGSSSRIIKIRKAFGADSQEWATMRQYFLERFGTNKGRFDPAQLANRWGALSDKSKAALIPETAARESYEKFIKVADEYIGDLNLKSAYKRPFGLVRRTEMLGPISGAMTVGLLGSGGWAAYSGNEKTGLALMVLGTLSLMAPRQAAKLMTEQRFTKWATESLSKTPEAFAGSVTRFASQMATMEPDEQAAAAEFFNTMNKLMPVKQMGGMGVVTGGR